MAKKIDDATRAKIMGRVATMMRYADEIELERRGKEGYNTVFAIIIKVDEAKARERPDAYGNLSNSGAMNDDKAGTAAMRAVDRSVGRETLKAMGENNLPLSKEERDDLHQEMKDKGIVQTAPRRGKRVKRTVRGRETCPKCGLALDESGVCKACVVDLLDRDDDGLFDVG